MGPWRAPFVRALASLGLLLLAGSAWAQPSALRGLPGGVSAGGDITVFEAPAVDPAQERLEDERRMARGQVPHFAAALSVSVDPWRHGGWQPEGRTQARWRLRIESKGALSLSLAFGRFDLPAGARLEILPSSGGGGFGPFTADDRDSHGQLWTPPVTGDALDLQLTVPVAGLDAVELELVRIHHGYAGFGEDPLQKAGSCHRDLACGDSEWRDAGRSVGLMTVEGVRFCTGFLVNNTAQDRRPLFLTALHCGVSKVNAASTVVMWNHQLPSCSADEKPPETTRAFQTGASLLAADTATDVVLLELDDPPDPAHGVAWAGWDRSEDDPRTCASIHHPNTGAKRLAIDYGPARTTAHLGDEEVAGGDHLRVGAWEIGSTEGGSSGAPLLNEDRRVVGWLRGGYAACGVRRADWFGRLSAAWHGPSDRRRLRDWLDPLDTQVLVLDPLDGPTVD
ncbi:MAG: serine protease [Acidobacteriota bacterium]